MIGRRPGADRLDAAPAGPRAGAPHCSLDPEITKVIVGEIRMNFVTSIAPVIRPT